jgi:hypothetical protein
MKLMLLGSAFTCNDLEIGDDMRGALADLTAGVWVRRLVL